MTRHVFRRRLREVAGGTAAECTAVWCCCPCALLNLIFIAVYKLPSAAFRRLCRRKRPPTRLCSTKAGGVESSPVKSLKCDKDVMRLEEEMWEKFDGSGFGRSLSQREALDKQQVA